MTEAEILSVRNEVTAIVVSVASFSFAMISAYIAALWLFLKHAPLTLRSLAFLLLTSGLAFMGVVMLVEVRSRHIQDSCHARRRR